MMTNPAGCLRAFICTIFYQLPATEVDSPRPKIFQQCFAAKANVQKYERALLGVFRKKSFAEKVAAGKRKQRDVIKKIIREEGCIVA